MGKECIGTRAGAGDFIIKELRRGKTIRGSNTGLEVGFE